MSNNPETARLLLVEGQDDKHVVIHLRQYYQSIPRFEIQEKGGFSALAASISPELKAPGRTALGIVVDANDDREAHWRSITDRLLSAGIQTPKSPETAGTVIDGSPRVGIWLMPDNQSEGELEDFVAKLVPPADPVWPMAAAYIDDIPSEHRKFKPTKESRATLATWLATREDPRKMGLAIKTGDLDASQPPAPAFAEWLRRTFG